MKWYASCITLFSIMHRGLAENAVEKDTGACNAPGAEPDHMSVLQVKGSASESFSKAVPFDTIFFMGTNLMPVLNVSIGKSPPQPLLIDTGSSSMAFCDPSLESVAESTADKLDSIWCAHYQPGGAIGYVYKGTARVVGYPDRPAYYSIMKYKYKMPCGSGLQGIAGIGFKNLNTVTKGSYIKPWNYAKVERQGTAPRCPRADEVLPSNLWNFLLGSDNAEHRLGVYWAGKEGPKTGMFYLDDDAVDNEYYKRGRPQQVVLDMWGWLSIKVPTLRLGNQAWNTAGLCGWSVDGEWDGRQPCIMDTGTPIIEIPHQVWPRYQGKLVYPVGQLEIQLDGVNGPVSIVFENSTELVEKGWLVPGNSVILGIPFNYYYYTSVDVKKSVVDVVRLTEARREVSKPSFMGKVASTKWDGGKPGAEWLGKKLQFTPLPKGAVLGN